MDFEILQSKKEVSLGAGEKIELGHTHELKQGHIDPILLRCADWRKIARST